MKSRSVVVFGKLIGAAGLGAALGASVAGLIAVVFGQAVQPGSTWLTGLPALAVIGAGVSALVAGLTRRWFLSAAADKPHGERRRLLLFTAAGLVVVPLAIAVGQLQAAATMAIPFMVAGSAVTLTLWMRAFRRTRRNLHGGRSLIRAAR
ncbi:hypothetical protein FNH05_33040 [Amycolatopsis rhizosphaerae]|uniref:Transmembrane protein n=1 Tax=Amycolatopsis rhizosphaerae TaxID=2053003 RepID=A0A558AGJ6_9PSEU|nr:hypothetical protein [Amycolatopsis rhizosphaerae]TVT23390.1 hypothetical protein FNH05_33040 [Amycolatopsis rhizosphaerae]